MTMFLFNTIRGEVEPVPGKDGWFQLTGKKITRECQPCEDILHDIDMIVVKDARLLGVHDFDEEIEYKDPRFNELDEPGFGVVKWDDNTYTAYLACNRPEYAFMRFVVPAEEGDAQDEEWDPISTYRKEA